MQPGPCPSLVENQVSVWTQNSSQVYMASRVALSHPLIALHGWLVMAAPAHLGQAFLPL